MPQLPRPRRSSNGSKLLAHCLYIDMYPQLQVVDGLMMDPNGNGIKTELAGRSTELRRCAETCGTGQARTPTGTPDQARTATETGLEQLVASRSLLAVVN